MFYTTAWCATNEESFRQAVTLEALGKSMRLHGSSIPFTIIMLEGMHLLSAAYIQTLESYGFTLIDYGEAFQDIVRDYSAIDKHYSRYERNCLLRWVAIRQLAAGRHGQCWHLDSDVVLHTSLDELAADTAGKTFMLQGCPVLVSIADPRWFDDYQANLDALNRDIVGYSSRAWAERDECIRRDAELANHTVYRNPLGSDQDLLEYLVSAQKIPQAPASSIFDSRYYFIQNGLVLRHWHAVQYRAAIPGLPGHSATGSHFSIDEHLRIHIGSKQVPFTHFQGHFSIYAGVYLTLRQLHIPDALARSILKFSIHDEEFRVSFLFKVLRKINLRRPLFKSRDSVIHLMLRVPDPPLLSLYELLLGRFA